MLRELDANLGSFGAEQHQYRLGPTLARSALDELAAKYAIELPYEYARFLQQAGNGGAGPGYGLQRFGFLSSAGLVPRESRCGEMTRIGGDGTLSIQAPLLYDEGNEIDRFSVTFWDAIERHALDGSEGPETLSRPFPYSTPAYGNSVELAGGANRVYDGSWMLVDYGCGMEARLILNGPLTGQVWVQTLEGDMVPFREYASLHSELELPEPAPGPFSFNQWYEHLLSARHAELVDSGR